MIGLSIQQIAAALGGDVIGRNSCNVPGPGHRKHDRSLTITVDRNRLVVYSHAGNDWRTCKDYVRGRLGLDRDHPASKGGHRPTFVVVDPSGDEDKAKKKKAALRIWGQSVSPSGTIVEQYLREHRGLELTPDIADSVVRFHGSLYFDAYSRKPGMVCLLRDIVTNEPCGIHRTFLDRDTAAKIDRKMLGVAKGAAIKLDCVDPGSRLTIGEGIETGLAAKLAGLGPVWALGSTSGIRSFPALDGVSELTLLQENDAASRQAVAICARRYLAAGKPVNLITPEIGNDLDDVWKAVNA
jgi:putative DNA primase/helicase